MFHSLQVYARNALYGLSSSPGKPATIETTSASSENVIGVQETFYPQNYLPLIILLAIFWPFLLSLIAASFSASAWLFWLLIGALFGFIQLLFVLYNFVMITWDLGVLTLLKTFAMIRSYVRYYTYKMTDAAGIEIKGRNRHFKKFRRRKEWREELELATSYKEYCQIELYEPQNMDVVSERKYNLSRVEPLHDPLVNHVDKIGLKRHSVKNNGEKISQIQQTPPSKQPERSPVKIENGISPSSSLDNHMRKIHSCLDLKKPNADVSSSRKPKRTSSTASLPITPSQEGDGMFFDSDENCKAWEKVVKEDLGMAGDLLLTTMYRLKEARMQASTTMSSSVNQQMKTSNNNNFITCDRKEQEENHNGDRKDTSHASCCDQVDGTTSSHTTSFSFSPDTSALSEDSSSPLKFLLSAIVKRNHLSVDDYLINDARSLAERGQHSLRKETRDAIDRYGDEVERCLEWIAKSPVYLVETSLSNDLDCISTDMAQSEVPSQSRLSAHENSNTDATIFTRQQVMQKQFDELNKRCTLVRRMKQNMGHTALMLSGGGAIAMYHLGTIKALVESGLYQDIHVISGTSGGSITAAMCAIKSPGELLRDVCVKTVSTDYMLTGEMKESNIRWFPELLDMGRYWLKNRVLADSAEFKRCCEFYYKDITFEEAFEMTKKHVCITVTASRANAGAGVQRLLLNHISTPNVTLASAVAASCSLPGFMTPAKLMIKDSRGMIVPFEVDGVEWIDGSVQADLPFKRISTLFNVSNYVVAQVNFHVVPFLNKVHHPNINTFYWKLFQICMWDIKNRVLNLSQLGLFPRLFGQDVTKVFQQKYYGNLTLVPRFTTMQLFGFKAFQNPTVSDMEIYLQDGQIAAWPYLCVLKEMLRIERSLNFCLNKLSERLQSVETVLEFPLSSMNDDVDSLSSVVGLTYRARLPGLGREVELLKESNFALEQENAKLRKQLVNLRHALGISSERDAMLEGCFVSILKVEEEQEDDIDKKELMS